MYPEIQKFLASLKSDWAGFSAERKQALNTLAAAISKELEEQGYVNLVFVCTHNSRRSHLAQIWSSVCAEKAGMDGIRSYSAGTEATALNGNVIATLERTGFSVKSGDSGPNPRYEISYSVESNPIICFSKTINDASLPKGRFIAIMTCSHAEENCPFIPGALHRIPITYEDPKLSDGSGKEEAVYAERSKQIAAEMMYVFSEITK